MVMDSSQKIKLDTIKMEPTQNFDECLMKMFYSCKIKHTQDSMSDDCFVHSMF